MTEKILITERGDIDKFNNVIFLVKKNAEARQT